ncbi:MULTISPECIES: hypothetical protein [unclassified Solwaraspora]|uniref:hypothetical protein n=1 Tax=unclassified Solwaraspora TaxID=2627926 RepID=UPI00259B236A|nr:hypothetical protein [Solwaraspora sp. WMMA2056]WJK41860.1 hypothetical protein O7608_05470 [Solwaraspora sp. WMMA2056]
MSNGHEAMEGPMGSRLLRTPEPKPGDVLLVGQEARMQFAGDRRVRFRVISVDRKPTYDGWVWLTGYVIDERGYAAERREIFVQRDGLYRLAKRQST